MTLKLYIGRKGANPELRVLSESPCPVTDPHRPDYQVMCGDTANRWPAPHATRMLRYTCFM